MRVRRLLLALVAVGGCSTPPAAPPPPVPAPAPVEAAPGGIKTTHHEIAIGNLEAQLAAAEKLAAAGVKDAETAQRLAALLVLRGQVLGRIADLERAAVIHDELVRARPGDPALLVGRASLRALFHRFREASDDLAAAEKRGLGAEGTAGERASVAQAIGDYDRAEALRSEAARVRPTLRSIGALASVVAERGDLARAEPLFADARAHFVDVSPFPLAALELAEGLMNERAGRLARARDLYEAAHARLPEHAAVASHLAGVLAATGDRDQAVALLEPLVRSSDDPEYAGQLAELLARRGRPDDAARAAALRAQAQARYDVLLDRHPAAYAAHAARFILARADRTAEQAARALALAELNVKTRPVDDSYELLLEAARAVGPQKACDAAARATRGRTPRESLRFAAQQAALACGQPAGATALAPR